MLVLKRVIANAGGGVTDTRKHTEFRWWLGSAVYKVCKKCRIGKTVAKYHINCIINYYIIKAVYFQGIGM